jgi:deoxyribodipyrimidine photo-lyase
MTEREQEIYHLKIGYDYPYPLVDNQISARAARQKIWGHRKNELVKQEKKRILATHTRQFQKSKGQD